MPNTPRIPISKAFTPAGDETPEVQGHMIRAGRMVEQPTNDDAANEEAEVEGHMPRIGRMKGPRNPQQPTNDDAPDDETEVEGHGSVRGS